MINPTRFLAGVASMFAATIVHAADVSTSGYTNDFSVQPPAADWSTRTMGAGGFTAASQFASAAQIDSAAQTNIASSFTAQVGSATGNPPNAAGTAVWASAGGYLQTRATQSGATLLLGRFVNEAGGDGTGARIVYQYTTNRAALVAEEVRGHRVFYSLSGLPNTWVNVPELSQTTEGTLSVELSFPSEERWAHHGTFYMLWADDNGSGTPDDALNIDNFYIEVTGTAASVRLASPENGSQMPDTNSVVLRALANPGPDATVTGVGFYEVSSGHLGSALIAPYNLTLNLTPAVYSVYAVSTNSLNLVVYSATNTFTVTNVPFSIALHTPTNNTTHATPTNVLLTAGGYAGDGQTFSGVGFYDVTRGLITSVINQPFSATIYFEGGTYDVYAVATNNANGTTFSATNRLVINVPPINTVAPRIFSQTPPHSTPVNWLTNIVVVFSEPVVGVDASDFLVDGVPATSVTGSGSNYTFRFAQPAYGQPVISWAADHGITDLGWPTQFPFDVNGDGATWGYYLIDQTPPTIAVRVPGANAAVTNASEITVTFSEAVTGVDASDLLVNGVAATTVSGSGATYTFGIVEPPVVGGPVPMAVTWALNHGITDVATAPNAFNRTNGTWNFTLDIRTILIQSNSMWRFVKGFEEASDPASAWRQLTFDASGWSNAPAPFFFGDPYSNGVPAYTHLSDMQSNYSTIYLRSEFIVPDATAITNLFLNLQIDDGAVVWINGVEARRVNAPAGEVPFDGLATGTTQEPQNAGAGYVSYALTNNAAGALVNGVNVIAIHGLNQSLTASSDFGFNAQLYTYIPDNEAVPPRLVNAEPEPGELTTFNSVTLTFNENVTGVDASDLLVNGVPATGISSLNAKTYTFTFAQPAAGPVTLSWVAGHGIVDQDTPPKSFDAAAGGLQYWRVQPDAPVVAARTPANGAMVNTVSMIAVTFSEAVTGVDAADLLVNGTAAASVTGSGASYTFTVAPPAYGLVEIGWSASPGIQDLEGNAFDGTRATNVWAFTFVDQAPPGIASQNPNAGSAVANLTSLSVTFTEPVAGVDVSDLLINGLPASGVSGSGANYTFTFPQPNATSVAVTWASGHGIRDLAPIANAFNASAPGSTWSYTTTDNVAPSIHVDPPPSAIVKNLTQIKVTFDEPVTGVNAGDLLINGTPAHTISGSGVGPYTFTFTRPATGMVHVAFAVMHGIQDTAAVPNAFGGGMWHYTLNPAIVTDIAVRHVVQMSIDGLASRYLAFYVTNAPARYPNFVRLMNEGAWTMNARCDYDISETIPNHTTMFTGRPVYQPAGHPNTTHHGYNNNFPPAGDTIHNTGNLNIPYKHSMFDVAHDHGRSTAFHAGKTRLDICDRSYNDVNGAADVTGEDNGRDKIDFSNVIDIQGQAISNQVNVLLEDLLSANPTEYLFVHIAEPDLTGHSTSWGSAAYSNIVAYIDTQLGRIIDAIDSNPALMNQTALIVSTDHGGGGGNPSSHTLASHPDNYTIPFFLRAPGIAAGIDAYELFSNRTNPGTNYVDYAAQPQPIRNGDGSNLALSLLALPPIPGSFMNALFATPQVTLRVARFEGQLSLFWGDVNDEYDLQTADTVNATEWQTITTGITTVETTKIYSVPNAGTTAKQFFRLRKR